MSLWDRENNWLEYILYAADIGGRESKEQLLDTVKSFIHIRGSGLSHTTTQRRRESISPENALKPRYFGTYILYIQSVINITAGLRRETLTPESQS